jgi:type IV pilus assembly protein PilA
MKKYKSSGFTLIELMIVVSIVGILAAIAVPNFISWTCKARQREIVTVFKGMKACMIGYRQNDSEATTGGMIETFIGANFAKVGYVRSGGSRYSLVIPGDLLQSDKLNDANFTGKLATCDGFGLPPIGLSNTDFTVHGCGNIDNDGTIDAWYSTNSLPPTNGTDDCDD